MNPLCWFYQAITLKDEEIVEMIFYPVVNEASRALEESVVVRSSDLDIASVLGMGFPAYRYWDIPISGFL
jgi:enoyl-CoA hydratase/3-hydroxyacyl-CoA dehydrogenase